MSETSDWIVKSAQLYEQHLVPAAFRPFAERLVDRVGVGAGHRVLDVACGTGIVARVAAARGASVTGTDANAAMLDVARRIEPGVDWREADAAAPTATAAYDIVTCQQGLQFLRDREAALAAWRDALRPGGRLAVAVWRPIEHQAGFRDFTAALDRVGGEELGDVMRVAFSGPTREEFGTLLGSTGWHDVRTVFDVGSIRFGSIEAFLHVEVDSTPLADAVDALPGDGRAELAAATAEALAPYVDDEGVTWPIEALVATATR